MNHRTWLGILAFTFAACGDPAGAADDGTCTDPGARRCTDGGTQTCIDDGGVWRWGDAIACPVGDACEAGMCLAVGGKEDGATTLDADGDGILRIDAILDHPNGKAYFFMGPSYLRYDLAADRVDPGFPKSIAGQWSGLFERDIDAVVRTSARDAWFFRGGEVLRYDLDADRADRAGPRPIADVFPGLWGDGIESALAGGDGKVYFFRGRDYMSWDIAAGTMDEGFPRLIEEDWPGLWAYDLDAALPVRPGAVVSPAGGAPASKVYFFSWDQYLRYDFTRAEADDGYPLERAFYWPGVWDPNEGTGRPGARLPTDVAALLGEAPDPAELAARRARVALSAGTAYVDLTPRYPRYVASIEARLDAYGCGLLKLAGTTTYRFRCATATTGARALDIAPFGIDSIDWQNAAYHHDQVSQGDFLAQAGTPLSILAADDDVFYIHALSANQPTGSIVAGLNIKVRFSVDGVEKVWGFSHLNTAVPRYVLDALADGTPLTVGTVFGFIGYTGNLWTGAPPATDAPYSGNGAGLPASHTHIWFATPAGRDDLQCHEKLPAWARRALDFSGAYPFGGG